jgi:hypothetical protein
VGVKNNIIIGNHIQIEVIIPNSFKRKGKTTYEASISMQDNWQINGRHDIPD